MTGYAYTTIVGGVIYISQRGVHRASLGFWPTMRRGPLSASFAMGRRFDFRRRYFLTHTHDSHDALLTTAKYAAERPACRRYCLPFSLCRHLTRCEERFFLMIHGARAPGHITHAPRCYFRWAPDAMQLDDDFRGGAPDKDGLVSLGAASPAMRAIATLPAFTISSMMENGPFRHHIYFLTCAET